MTNNIAILLLFVAIQIVSGCGFSTRPIEPVVSGGQQFFRLEWQTARRGSERIVQGAVRNDWSQPAANVRLLVEALDPPDRIVSQRLVGLGGQLAPGVVVPFEMSMPPATTYRVRMFSFDWVQAGETFGR